MPPREVAGLALAPVCEGRVAIGPLSDDAVPSTAHLAAPDTGASEASKMATMIVDSNSIVYTQQRICVFLGGGCVYT